MSISKTKKYLQDLNYFSLNRLYKIGKVIYNNSCVRLWFGCSALKPGYTGGNNMALANEMTLPPRSIQEYVPGKQLTLAHRISKPDRMIYKKLGLTDEFTEAIGIITITPAESAIIAADICTKAARVKLGFVDRFSGAVVFVGEIGAVDSALAAVIDRFNDMHYTTVNITRT